MIETLLAAGADVERGNDGWRPLHYAAAFNENPAVIETLLAAGADVERGNDYGSRPLHYAAQFNENPAVIETLLAAGADVEREMLTVRGLCMMRRSPTRIRP